MTMKEDVVVVCASSVPLQIQFVGGCSDEYVNRNFQFTVRTHLIQSNQDG